MLLRRHGGDVAGDRSYSAWNYWTVHVPAHGIVGGGVAWGLLELNNIVRTSRYDCHRRNRNARPSVSAATVMVQPKALAFGGLEIMVRVIVRGISQRRSSRPIQSATKNT